MKSIPMFVSGILLILVGLWGGAWLIGQFPFQTTYNFPAILTAIFTFAAGVVLAVFGSIPKDFLK
jgi:hypothetical protein